MKLKHQPYYHQLTSIFIPSIRFANAAIDSLSSSVVSFRGGKNNTNGSIDPSISERNLEGILVRTVSLAIIKPNSPEEYSS
ncbi:MAG: hypothetical protein YK1312THETA_120001 [Marine Group I thaumarchaeote]|nr:MAG: hypothetical protein YK1312THETA_120001 [Marine Group I thaumarchaeote]